MGWFEVQLQCLFQILKSFFFTFALAGYIQFEALGDIPVPFAPDSRGEWSLHCLHCFTADWPPTWETGNAKAVTNLSRLILP
jgi:hypothetical protein